MWNTLGLSILSQTLKTASLFFSNNPHYGTKETKSCYAFVQGTGLDTLIFAYGLEFDPENLRQSFNYYIKRKHHD